MKLVPWLKFDKENKLTAKLLCNDVVPADYDIVLADYDVIIQCLKHLVYNFMGFVVQTLKNVSLNKYKVKTQKRVLVALLTIF